MLEGFDDCDGFPCMVCFGYLYDGVFVKWSVRAWSKGGFLFIYT